MLLFQCKILWKIITNLDLLIKLTNIKNQEYRIINLNDTSAIHTISHIVTKIYLIYYLILTINIA